MLYGLKSSGASWHEYFSKSLYDLGFTPSYADHDIWYHKAVKPSVFQYYEYILVYVDDLLIISYQIDHIAQAIKSTYQLKADLLIVK